MAWRNFYAIAPNGQFLFRMMKVEIDETDERNRFDDGRKVFQSHQQQKALENIYSEINKLENHRSTGNSVLQLR